MVNDFEAQDCLSNCFSFITVFTCLVHTRTDTHMAIILAFSFAFSFSFSFSTVESSISS
jgi:hypothetical protein